MNNKMLWKIVMIVLLPKSMGQEKELKMRVIQTRMKLIRRQSKVEVLKNLSLHFARLKVSHKVD